jgi:hypothetical protein
VVVSRLSLHQVVSELEIHCIFQVKGEKVKEDRVLETLWDCLQVGNNPEDSQEDCRMKLETLLVQSDSSRFSRRADRDNTMVTEGHRHAGRKSKAEKLAEMDKELAEIRADIEKLELRMQQKAKPRWVYEWPMKKPKEKWPVKELMVRRQRRLLRGWLRYAENLNGPEEEMVQVCEPETGRGLNDEENELGSAEISRTARRAERKFQFSRWATS